MPTSNYMILMILQNRLCFKKQAVGMILDCDSGCRGFEPHQPPHIFKQSGTLWHSSQWGPRHFCAALAGRSRSDGLDDSHTMKWYMAHDAAAHLSFLVGFFGPANSNNNHPPSAPRKPET